MLKGHVFKEQIFGNQIFALFINTFLNGQNGVSNNYKNGMQVTYSSSTLTIQSGVVCVQGRFLEEDTSTDVLAGTDTSYCKLVIEIDLDKENTESQLNQASYKIVKSTSGYPSLTQNNIIANNSGIYQYELARFRTTSNGIADFQDRRTFLDFDSIYEVIKNRISQIIEELEAELEDVEDGSAYMLNTINAKSLDIWGRNSGATVLSGTAKIRKSGKTVSLMLKASMSPTSVVEEIGFGNFTAQEELPSWALPADDVIIQGIVANDNREVVGVADLILDSSGNLTGKIQNFRQTNITDFKINVCYITN